MNKRHPVLERLSRGQSLVLDGGVGTELLRRGFRSAAPLYDAAAAREVPEILSAIHAAAIDAGVDILTAYTGRSTVRALSRGGLGMRAAAITSQAVDLALEAVQKQGRQVVVAGCLSAMDDNASPDRCAPRTLADEHAEQATRIAAAGCEMILVEGMRSHLESLAATAAAQARVPTVWSTILLGEKGLTRDGIALATAAGQLVAVGASAVLLEGPKVPELVAAVGTLAGLALGVPLGARFSREADEKVQVERMATELAVSLQRGARILGGARGSTPELLKALAQRVRSRVAA